MLLRDKIAGILVAFGAVGLAMAPLFATASAKDTRTAAEAVAIAITTGPQLKLLQESDVRRTATGAPAQGSIVCSQVIRLTVADVGLRCSALPAKHDVALVRQ